MIKFKLVSAACTAGLLFIAAPQAGASEIVYRPINPAFGGDPFNGSFLLETARAQGKQAEIKFPEIEFPDFSDFEGPVIIINSDGSVNVPEDP